MKLRFLIDEVMFLSFSLSSSCHFPRRHLSVRMQTEAVAAATASDCTLGRRSFNTSSCTLTVSPCLRLLLSISTHSLLTVLIVT